jgi:hypothetical protein
MSFLVVLGFELKVTKQALYHLSHTSIPFCSGHFGDRVWLFAHAAWNMSSYFMLPSIAGMTGTC